MIAQRSADGETSGLIPADVFRQIFAGVAASAAVVAVTDSHGRPHGFACTAMCAVSVDPPLLLVCVAKTSETLPLIERASSFVVTIMSPGGEDSVSRLATKSPGKFDRIGWTPSPISGHPIITAHRSAFLDCVVAERISAGDHDVFIARIVGGEHTPAAAPLIYLRRQFHRIVELDPEVTCANGPNSGRMK